MNDNGSIVLSAVSGLLLSLFFFAGLWWTTSRLPTSAHPALLMFCSLSLRMSVMVGGFFVLSSGHWQRLTACLAGFALARLFMRWATRIERRSTFAGVMSRKEGSA